MTREQEDDCQNEEIELFAEPDQNLSNLPINQIIAADDQIINIQVLKSYFAELNIEDRV